MDHERALTRFVPTLVDALLGRLVGREATGGAVVPAVAVYAPPPAEGGILR
eukprot:gene39627-25125_t